MPRKKKEQNTEGTPISFDLDAPTNDELLMQQEDELVVETFDETSKPFVNWTYTEQVANAAEHDALRAIREKNNLIIGSFAEASKGRLRPILESTAATAENENDTVYLLCFEGPVTVKVPFDQLIEEIPANMVGSTEQALVDQMNFINKFIGAKIPFVVTSFSDNKDGSYTAVASRIQALRRIRARYFGDKAPNPIKEGSIVKAQIVSIGTYAAYVNVNGVDTRIAIHQMTHQYLPNMKARYRTGDMIDVKLIKIEKAQKGQYKLEVSGKDAEATVFPYLMNRFRPNARCNATVISVTVRKFQNDTRLQIKLWLEDIGVPAIAFSSQQSYRNILTPGDTVIFQMERVSRQQDYIYGRIILVPKHI